MKLTVEQVTKARIASLHNFCDADGWYVSDAELTAAINELLGDMQGLQATPSHLEVFHHAVKFIQLRYREWHGDANGATITLTGCANMIASFITEDFFGSMPREAAATEARVDPYDQYPCTCFFYIKDDCPVHGIKRPLPRETESTETSLLPAKPAAATEAVAEAAPCDCACDGCTEGRHCRACEIKRSTPARELDEIARLTKEVEYYHDYGAKLERELAELKGRGGEPVEEDEYKQVNIIKNLSMMVRRLAYRHPNLKLREQAFRYLEGEGLQGSILRDEPGRGGETPLDAHVVARNFFDRYRMWRGNEHYDPAAELAIVIESKRAQAALAALRNLHSKGCEVFKDPKAITCGCLSRAIAELQKDEEGKC